jgi:hypothetical protein
MKKYIVITSIFEPTEAVKAFAALPDYRLLVVGDKKSPAHWQWDGVKYLSVETQQNLPHALSAVLPYNHYSRKMLGYLEAMSAGAEWIVDTDDDNIPYENWQFPATEGEFNQYAGDSGFVNVYQYFSDDKIWPRGLPLRLINTRYDFSGLKQAASRIGIWQGLADEDPDVDAIYRLTSDKPCYFKKKAPLVLANGQVCPFNTQNTLIHRALFPLMYLPTYVTFRYTDILRGLVAQPIMWLYGYQLGFTEASVIQKRNPHDYMKDFISEIPMYETGEQVIDWVQAAIHPNKSITENLWAAYEALLDKKVVETREMVTLRAWLDDIARLGF